MRAALESARVGVVVLDRHFLMKDWPMRELRALMARDRALPVRLLFIDFFACLAPHVSLHYREI
jgi:hypothetical protein